MNAPELASAQIDKARHARRCEQARQDTDAALKRLALMAVSGADAAAIQAARSDLIAMFTLQLDLLIQAPTVDRRVKEAEK